MSGRARVTRHGANHLPGGSDPIPAIGGGSGLQFDTDPQSGNWLRVTTTNGPVGPTGPETFSMLLEATGSNFDDGIGIHASSFLEMKGSDIDIYTTSLTGNGQININAANKIRLVTNDSGGSEPDIRLESIRDIIGISHRDTVFATYRDFEIQTDYDVSSLGGDVRITTGSGSWAPGDMNVSLSGHFQCIAGTTVEIGAYSTMYLWAVDNITVQILTGKTLTVIDNGGNPIFRVDEDGDLHGKTGKALTFDL